MKLNSKGDLLMTWVVIISSFAIAVGLIVFGVTLAQPFMARYEKDNVAYNKEYQKRIEKELAAKAGILEKTR